MARCGQLVLEQYWNCTSADPQDFQSVTKSLLGAMCGGIFNNLQGTVLDFFPEFSADVIDLRWRHVTIRHLLTMTAGLQSELTHPAYDDAWFSADDPVKFALTQKLVADPGATFHYSNASTHLLGEVLARATGERLDTALRSRLLDPIGAELHAWPTDKVGRPFGSGYVHLTPLHALRFGQLVLQRGMWNGMSVVDGAWLQASIQPQVRAYEWMEGIAWYGYLWWVTREAGLEAWYATGWGGQYIAVFPQVQLVVVMTGETVDHPNHRYVIRELVLPAVGHDLTETQVAPGSF